MRDPKQIMQERNRRRIELPPVECVIDQSRFHAVCSSSTLRPIMDGIGLRVVRVCGRGRPCTALGSFISVVSNFAGILLTT